MYNGVSSISKKKQLTKSAIIYRHILYNLFTILNQLNQKEINLINDSKQLNLSQTELHPLNLIRLLRIAADCDIGDAERGLFRCWINPNLDHILI